MRSEFETHSLSRAGSPALETAPHTVEHVTPRTAVVGVVLAVAAAPITYLGGPALFVLGLLLALAAVLLGVQSLVLQRSPAGWLAALLGSLVLLIPVAQFLTQS